MVTSDLFSETPSTSIDTTVPASVGTSTSAGLSTAAIAGLIIGLFLSLLLGAAIVVVVVALGLMKHRQTKGKYSTNKEHALGMALCLRIYSHIFDSEFQHMCSIKRFSEYDTETVSSMIQNNVIQFMAATLLMG